MLALELGLFSDVRATVEARVPNPQIGVDLRRGDIKVHQSSTTHVDPRRGRHVPRDPALRRPGHFRGPAPQDVALRFVMQAPYMLADIVAAIPAVDLAVEAVVREGGSERVGVCCAAFAPPSLNWLPWCILPKHT